MSSSPNSELIHRAQTQTQARKPTSDPPPPPPPQPASPMSHALRNRVPFLLIGIALAALFFHAFPIAESEPESTLPTRRVLLEESTTTTNDDAVSRAKSSSSSVPAGVRGRRKRIVVTGGAGFVGSHLVDRLIERGDSVIVIDNMFTGRKYNLLHHLGNPNFELIRHDVVEPILLEVDQIYHLACPASPVHYKYNPVKTIISFPTLVFLFNITLLFHFITLSLSLSSIISMFSKD